MFPAPARRATSGGGFPTQRRGPGFEVDVDEEGRGIAAVSRALPLPLSGRGAGGAPDPLLGPASSAAAARCERVYTRVVGRTGIGAPATAGAAAVGETGASGGEASKAACAARERG